ncbi:hypothetical protein L218DRAFT_750525 [Marasmius fiardii PR-910]|nr:hypothetical protein L218DRAFT_750525 [Marasmius fiardii PR-910]
MFRYRPARELARTLQILSAARVLAILHDIRCLTSTSLTTGIIYEMAVATVICTEVHGESTRSDRFWRFQKKPAGGNIDGSRSRICTKIITGRGTHSNFKGRALGFKEALVEEGSVNLVILGHHSRSEEPRYLGCVVCWSLRVGLVGTTFLLRFFLSLFCLLPPRDLSISVTNL